MSAITIPFVNDKGGCGKTFAVSNLGPALAEIGFRVGLIDFEPQGDLSRSYGIEPEPGQPCIEDALADASIDVRDALVDLPSSGQGALALLPATSALWQQTARLGSGDGRDLSRLLDPLRDDFDILLVDTPAGMSPFTIQAVLAAQQIVVPVFPAFLEITALFRILDSVGDLANAEGIEVGLLGVLLGNADRRLRQTREALDALEQADLGPFDAMIPAKRTASDHAAYGVPTFLLRPDDTISEAFRSVARELVGRLQETNSIGVSVAT